MFIPLMSIMDLSISKDGRVHLRYLGVKYTANDKATSTSPLFFLNNGFTQVRKSPFQTEKGKIMELLFWENLFLLSRGDCFY